jgi:BASS family bile acid:Na+ symporter
MLSGTTLVLVAFLTVFLMIGIGTTLTVADFQRAVTQPRGVLIGLASQYGWMPLLGYSAAKLANLPNEMAVGLMVMTCASGGNASNLFSWFARADVALSVSMTAIAAVLSVVAMPLLLAAYASGFTTEDLQMPYQQIAATLVGMLVPLGLGMAIRHFRPTWASKLERPGMLSGALMLGIVLWAGAPDMVANVQAMTGQMLGSCLAVAASGMLLGYLAARLGGLPSAQRRAVAFETGIQNTPVVIAVVLASFPGPLQQPVLHMPLVYAMFVLVLALVVTVALRIADRVRADPHPLQGDHLDSSSELMPPGEG